MKGSTFSIREVKEIIISVVVLSFVFAYPEAISNPLFMLISFFAVGIAFIGHELSHRYVARRLGYFAEYRIWQQGLLFALFFAVLSRGNFVFAAPGAVVFSAFPVFRNPSRSDIGRIGIAGTVFNIILMYSLIALYLFFPINMLLFAATINGWLAIFNLIPFGPLDGRKVLAWNKTIWLAVLVLAGIGFFLSSSGVF